MADRHSLLRRQLRRHLGDGAPLPADLQRFVQAVDEAYHEFDADRRMLERSLELSSQELLQANSKMRAMLQAIPDLFFRLDRDGTVLDCEAGTLSDLFGEAAHLRGRRICDIPVEEVSLKFQAAIQRVRDTDRRASIEYCLDLKGKPQWYEARLLPLMKDQVLVLVRNVSERKRMDEEFVRISKLESLGVLAGGIAHDFNNILTAIIGNLAIAKDHVDDREALGEMLSETERAAHRATKLARQLLTFSKGGLPVKRATHIADLLKDSVRFALTGSNVRCEFEISPHLPSVSVDEGQMSQVIDNLVINAKQAMPSGGTIHIEAGSVVVGEEAVDGIHMRPGTYVRLAIQDSGTGIPKEHLEKIFDPYFTTKQTGGGLGLATVYSVLEKHEGYVTVRSELGVGTIFSAYLPASTERVLEPAVARMTGTGQGSILVMDDEDMVRDVVRRMLERLGYSVGVARSGEEAIVAYRRALEQGEPFDAVIMDLTIPAGMGGKEAIRALQQVDPHVRAIVSSGYSEEPIMAEFGKYGFSGVVAKPYDMNELAKALQDVLTRVSGA